MYIRPGPCGGVVYAHGYFLFGQGVLKQSLRRKNAVDVFPCRDDSVPRSGGNRLIVGSRIARVHRQRAGPRGSVVNGILRPGPVQVRSGGVVLNKHHKCAVGSERYYIVIGIWEGIAPQGHA